MRQLLVAITLALVCLTARSAAAAPCPPGSGFQLTANATWNAAGFGGGYEADPQVSCDAIAIAHTYTRADDGGAASVLAARALSIDASLSAVWDDQNNGGATLAEQARIDDTFTVTAVPGPIVAIVATAHVDGTIEKIGGIRESDSFMNATFGIFDANFVPTVGDTISVVCAFTGSALVSCGGEVRGEVPVGVPIALVSWLRAEQYARSTPEFPAGTGVVNANLVLDYDIQVDGGGGAISYESSGYLPEPGDAQLAVAGLGALGALAIRRRERPKAQ